VSAPLTLDEAKALALEHASAGRPVFPIAIGWDDRKGKCNKRPLTVHGHKDASADPGALEAMFRAATLRAGEEFGVGWHCVGRVVLDLDVRSDADGRDSLAALEAQHGQLPAHQVVLTQSGGEHHHFLSPAGTAVRNVQNDDGKLGPAIDVRSADGWVVAPGTRTSWGSWDWDDVTQDADEPELPGWVLTRLNGAANGNGARPGPWSQLDRSELHPADLEVLEVFERDFGGHSAYRGSNGTVCVVRPGKAGGNGASIGYLGPGVVKVWTSDWPPLKANRTYDVDGLRRLLEPEPAEVEPGADPVKYFDKTGLLVTTLADDIIAMGPLAYGVDDITWAYSGGVWRPDRHVVRRRAARLLGSRYRRSHGTNAEDVVRFRSSEIKSEPVPESINFTNGLLDWRTGELLDHTHEVLSTVQLSVDYSPEAICPRFDEFLTEVLPADAVTMVWELIGYLMYSGNPLHKAVMLTGNGNNGKGTLLRVLTKLLGGEANVTAVSLHDLVNTRFTTASLFGKLANIAGDIDAKYLENTAMFKAITGGDSISAEHKGRDRFDFTPWAVPVFSANKVPPSADTTTGYFRRWLVVPFPNDFTGREDRSLDDKLQDPAELQGIAARGVAHLRHLLDRGDFELAEAASEARDEFVRRVDQVRTWIDDRCSIDPAHKAVNRSGLYVKYSAWARTTGHGVVKSTEFYDRLDAIGPPIEAVKIHGTRSYRGIRVVDDGGTL
jgi:putative DNA primase/helicase